MKLRAFGLFLCWFVLMLAVIAGDRLWPLSGARNILLLTHPSDTPVCIYFMGGLTRGSDQYREYLLLPSTFRSAKGIIIQRTAGEVTAADSSVVAIKAVAFAAIGVVTFLISYVRSKRSQDEDIR